MSSLEDDKRKQNVNSVDQKRKAVNDEIDELTQKKQCPQKDISAMVTSADDYAEKPEKIHQLTWIAKSNSLRRSAKEKSEEMKSVEQKLDEKLQDLTNN